MSWRECRVVWCKTRDVDFPWEAQVDGTRLRVRLNDFPAEPLYTLLVDGQEQESFDEWPSAWKREPLDAAAALSDELPASVGPYRVLEHLGRGGMGVVYRAEHPESGQQVAIKTVRSLDAQLLQSLRREIRALARIWHPGIVRVLAEGLDEPLPWYAMEFVTGVSLDRYVARPKLLSPTVTPTPNLLATTRPSQTPVHLVGAVSAGPRIPCAGA